MNTITQEAIKENILQFFLSKNKLNHIHEADLLAVNYIDTKLLDSIEFIGMIAEFEESFDIQFSQENLESESFKTIGGLIEMVISLKV